MLIKPKKKFWMPGVAPYYGATGSVVTQLSLDGSNSVNSSAGFTVPLTTTKGSGLIAVAIITNSNGVINVTAPGLTFTQRTGSPVSGQGVFILEWTAPYSSNFSGNIAISMTVNAFTTATVFGIAGAKMSAPFDTNASVPTTAGSGNAAITTNNANDFIFANYASNVASPTQGVGWTLINGSNFQLVEYQIVASTQLALTATFGTGTSSGGIIDAVVRGQ